MENNDDIYNWESSQPTTIEELKQWYAARHLPPEEVTRFFIGKNIEEPKAFGIYKDEQGECVVYKNKASGERSIRYQGPDEAFAVGELLQRLKDEILRQKEKRKNSSATPSAAAENNPVQMSIWDVLKEHGKAVTTIETTTGTLAATAGTAETPTGIQTGRLCQHRSLI